MVRRDICAPLLLDQHDQGSSPVLVQRQETYVVNQHADIVSRSGGEAAAVFEVIRRSVHVCAHPTRHGLLGLVSLQLLLGSLLKMASDFGRTGTVKLRLVVHEDESMMLEHRLSAVDHEGLPHPCLQVLAHLLLTDLVVVARAVDGKSPRCVGLELLVVNLLLDSVETIPGLQSFQLPLERGPVDVGQLLLELLPPVCRQLSFLGILVEQKT